MLLATEIIKANGITDVFVLCKNGELRKYRVPNLLQEYTQHQLRVHHCPFDDGDVLPLEQLLQLLTDLHNTLQRGATPLIQ